VEEKTLQVFAVSELRRAKEQLGAEVTGLRLWAGVLKQEDRGLSEARELGPQGLEAPCLSNVFIELFAVVGLRGGG
jgi:hypothetical protein